MNNYLQYLLNIHKEQGNKRNIFPLELSYILNNNITKETESYFINDMHKDEYELISYNKKKIEDKREEIHNKLQNLLNNNMGFSGELLELINYSYIININNYKSPNKLYFFDVEEDFDFNLFKEYINFGLSCDIPDYTYILWKSCKNDINYNYNRKFDKSFYDPKNYIQKEKIFDDTFDGLNNIDIPNYKKFYFFEDDF